MLVVWDGLTHMMPRYMKLHTPRLKHLDDALLLVSWHQLFNNEASKFYQAPEGLLCLYKMLMNTYMKLEMPLPLKCDASRSAPPLRSMTTAASHTQSLLFGLINLNFLMLHYSLFTFCPRINFHYESCTWFCTQGFWTLALTLTLVCRCLVHVVRSANVRYSKVRPLHPLCQFDICRHEVRYGCQREDSCSFAHSVIELKCWVLQQDTGTYITTIARFLPRCHERCSSSVWVCVLSVYLYFCFSNMSWPRGKVYWHSENDQRQQLNTFYSQPKSRWTLQLTDSIKHKHVCIQPVLQIQI